MLVHFAGPVFSRGRGVFFVCGVLALFCFGNAWGDASATLSIGDGQGTIGADVPIAISLAANGTQAATISFDIVFDAQSLAFKSASPGAAVIQAGKEVDANVAADGSLRLLVFGGTTVLSDGVLLTATFTILSAGNDSTPLTGDDLSISDPNAVEVSGTILAGAIQGNCAAPPAPTDVAASQGQPDGVDVSWSPVDGAAAYRVYRGDPATPSDIVPISDWLPDATSFTDTTAAVPGAAQPGCFGPGTPGYVTYEYMVRARNASGCASALSAPAQGYRGPASAAASVIPAFSGISLLGDLIAWVFMAGALALCAKRRPVMNAFWMSTLTRGCNPLSLKHGHWKI